eukprot:3253595-Pyramimonas_sp.AAC.1
METVRRATSKSAEMSTPRLCKTSETGAARACREGMSKRKRRRATATKGMAQQQDKSEQANITTLPRVWGGASDRTPT